MALLPIFFLVGIVGGFYQGATGIESPVGGGNARGSELNLG
jgi:hypothetical protein